MLANRQEFLGIPVRVGLLKSVQMVVTHILAGLDMKRHMLLLRCIKTSDAACARGEIMRFCDFLQMGSKRASAFNPALLDKAKKVMPEGASRYGGEELV